jgi:hypothetical protein
MNAQTNYGLVGKCLHSIKETSVLLKTRFNICKYTGRTYDNGKIRDFAAYILHETDNVEQFLLPTEFSDKATSHISQYLDVQSCILYSHTLLFITGATARHTQHTTNTRDEHPCHWQDSNPQSQHAYGRRTTP